MSRTAWLAAAAAADLALTASPASAQSSFIAPDGRNRYPGVTIFCPNGTGVTPCNFGSGGGGSGTVSVNLGGQSVSLSNRFPVSDPLLDSLVSGGALSIGGTVGLSLGGAAVGAGNRMPVSDAALDALIAGGALPVTGSVTLGGTPAVSVASLPPLPAGSNAIGSVTVGNFPAMQSIGGTVAVGNFPVTQSVAGTVALAAGSVGAVTAAGTAGASAMAVQGAPGGLAVPVSGTFWQATQPVSAASLPLPGGAATAAAQAAPLAPVTPASATATQSVLIGCQAATSLPSFSAGQQGAVPCDTSGRPYVVTVPSANNVPAFLQAVTAGGASTYTAVNAAGSCMAATIKSGSGMVFGYTLSNTGTSGVWARLFASASAPVCGSGTPARRIYVPAGSTVSLATDLGWVFAGGIGVDVTAGSGSDSDTATLTAANAVFVNVDYK